MSNIKRIRIEFNNLSNEEQLNLWMNLFHFANERLPDDKELIITIEKVKK